MSSVETTYLTGYRAGVVGAPCNSFPGGRLISKTLPTREQAGVSNHKGQTPLFGKTASEGPTDLMPVFSHFNRRDRFFINATTEERVWGTTSAYRPTDVYDEHWRLHIV